MYLFVYGTLKRGHHNHRVLEDARYTGEAHLDCHRMYSLGGFPGIVRGEGSVYGEVYDVEDFTRLDRLEGYDPTTHSGMYLREQIPGWAPGSYVYIWNGRVDERNLIEDGVWRR